MLRINLFFNPLLWIIFFGSIPISFAQNVKLDSLQYVLKTHTKIDTIRVNVLNEIVTNLINYDIDSSKILLKNSEKFAKQLQYKKGEAHAISLNGKIQLFTSNFEEALQYFQNSKKMYAALSNQKGIIHCNSLIGKTYAETSNHEKSIATYKLNLEIHKRSGDKLGIGSDFTNIGVVHFKYGAYKEAEEYYNKALTILTKISKPKHLIAINNNLGNLYGAQGNYSAALNYYLVATDLQKELDDNPRKRAQNLIRIGMAYGKLEDYDKCLKYFKQSLKVSEQIKDKLNAAMCLSNIGLVYLNQKKIKEASASLKKALTLGEEINSKGLIANVLQNLGNIQVTAKNYDVALEYYKKALKINLEIIDVKNTSRSYTGICRIYYYKKDLKKALNYALKAQKLSDELKLLERQKNLAELLSKIYHDSGNYKEAYASQIRFKKLNDSVFNKRSIQKMAQLESEYKYKERLDTAVQEVKTIDAKLEDSNQQKLWWITGFLCLLIVLGFTFFWLRIRKLKTQKQHILMEQRLLRSQMNPHFMFNTLSAIKTQIKKDQNKGLDHLSKFSKHLRLVLENSLNNYVLLNKELEALKKYMDLELHRFPNSFTYSFHLKNITDDELLFIPPMLLQPFIENSIKHGFLNIDYLGEIVVTLKKKNAKYIHCEIKDNGTGTIKPRNVDKSSLSTKLISSFIEKSTKSKVKIINLSNINKDNKGVIITFLIPYTTNGHD